MPIRQSTLIEVKWTKLKGRGVFALSDIPKDTVFERVPVLVIPADQVFEGPSDDPVLGHYVFEWTDRTVAVALGYGSLYNHSYTPNATYRDIGKQTKEYVALRDIAAGEEITVNYNAEPTDRTPVSFTVR